MVRSRARLRARQRLGQYRIDRHLATGGFSSVYAATDTIAGVKVALKVLHEGEDDAATLGELKREVRIASRIDHPNVLSIRHAGTVDGRFVIVTALARESLEERLARRIGRRTVIDVAGQVLAGLAEAHSRRIVHCDVKAAEHPSVRRGARPHRGLRPRADRRAQHRRLRLGDRRLHGARAGARQAIAAIRRVLGGADPVPDDVGEAPGVALRVAVPGRGARATQLPQGPHRIRPRRAVSVDSRKRFASCVPMKEEFDALRRRALRATRTR